MATFSLSDTSRRAQATGNNSAGPFSFSFQINLQTDLKVYVDSTLKTLTTHYTVTIGASGNGSISFTSGNHPTNSQTVTILSDVPVARTSVYTAGGNITAAALESDFDTQAMMLGDREERETRTVMAPVNDPTNVDMTLPAKADRLGKVLGFNSSTGNPEATQQVTGASVSVSALSAGATPTASVSVSSGTAAFALGIPAGATGATGAAGADSTVAGPQGPAGQDGADGDNTITVKDEGSALSTAASTINFVGNGVTASGTGAEKTVTITDTNTTYSVGDGGLSEKNFTTALNTKLSGIASSANNYSLPTASGSTLGGIKIGSGLSIDSSGVVTASGGSGSSLTVQDEGSALSTAATTMNFVGNGVVASGTGATKTITVTDTNTTYSVGDGGLTENNFTNTLKSKLDGIAASANNYTLPIASYNTLGGVKVGVGFSIHNTTGLLELNLPAPTTYALGGVLAHSSSPIDFSNNGIMSFKSDVVSADHLNVSGNGTTSQYLRSDGDGTFTWATPPDTNTTYSVGDGGLTEKNFTTALNTKLSGIETNATADQTNAEIRAAVEAATDSNVFTDADHSKLNAIAASATANPNALDNLSEDSSPQLGGNLDVNGNDIVSTSNGSIDLDPNGSGKVTFKGNSTRGAGQFVLNCEQNSHGITIKGPPHSAGASYTLTLPDNDGSSGQSLITDGSGNTSWSTISGSGSYTLPTASGSTLGGIKIGSGLSIDGSGVVTASGGGGGGADLYAANESSPSAQPSATGANAIAIGDSAIASGSQAVALSLSRASGSKSFAAGIGDNSTSYGASSNNTVAIGGEAKASSGYATAIGYGSSATAGGSIALNGATSSGNSSLAIGLQSTASADNSIAIGSRVTSNIIGKFAVSTNRFASNGDNCAASYRLQAATTDATATVMTTNQSSASSNNQIVAASDTAISFLGTITAIQNGAQAYASWKVEGLLVNDGGTTTLVNSAITVIQNSSNWGMALSADNTNNALAVTCTGEASHNIRWMSNIQTSEVTYS